MFNLCWHKWTKWGELMSQLTGGKRCQFRKCEKCGIIGQRSFVIPAWVRTEDINKDLEQSQ